MFLLRTHPCFRNPDNVWFFRWKHISSFLFNIIHLVLMYINVILLRDLREPWESIGWRQLSSLNYLWCVRVWWLRCGKGGGSISSPWAWSVASSSPGLLPPGRVMLPVPTWVECLGLIGDSWLTQPAPSWRGHAAQPPTSLIPCVCYVLHRLPNWSTSVFIWQVPNVFV